MHSGGRVFDRLEFGYGGSRYEESGGDHEHLFDLEIGMVTGFYQLELKTLKEQIAREVDYKPADQRLRSVGLKLKSCPLLTKSIRHKTAAHQRLVTFCKCGSFGVCSAQKEPRRFISCENATLGKIRDKRHPQYLFLSS